MRKFSKINLLVASLFSVSAYAADMMKIPNINVVSTTPLAGIGVELSKLPSSIQRVNMSDFKGQAGVSVADYMNSNMSGVSINETQGNPWMPDVQFRGYTASPLVGSPQGISVYVDGVRMNDPFGETVNWDLIPSFAIGGMQLVPGSNPVYGMNTLGGAISIQTKSGRDFQGAAADFSFGSWGRRTALAEFGGVSKDKSVDYYVGYQNTHEDGWRKYSPSNLNQLFAKTGWQNEKSRIGVSYIGADNKLIGNGLTPNYMLDIDREMAYTRPDETKNYYHHLTLNGDHWLSDTTLLSANGYYRKSNRNTYNGDVNDDYNEDFTRQNLSGGTYTYTSGLLHGCRATENGSSSNSTHFSNANAENCAEGALNRTSTKQDVYGLNLQAAFNNDVWGKKNALTVGTAFEHSKIKFDQTSQLTEVTSAGKILSGFDSTRALINLDDDVENVHKLSSKTRNLGLFATDTLSLNNQWHLTGGVRYNYFQVDTDDKLIALPDDRSLSGKHSFNRINPSVGLAFTPTDKMSVYGSYSESNRAPSAIELGCANPARPCKLPNAMAGDPPLDQVVAKTYEVGTRGKFSDLVGWSASAYQTKNHNDIQFIASTTSGAGFFDNISRTKRAGLDFGLNGQYDKLRWFANYSYVRAQYDTEFEMPAEYNSTANADGMITVKKGDTMAGIPKHQLKLRAQYAVTPSWTVGTNVIGFSDRYLRGNENNDHATVTNSQTRQNADENVNEGPGKLAGYFTVNLDTTYNVGNGWKLYAKAINVFDRDYATGGQFGFSPFTGLTTPDTGMDFAREGRAFSFLAPGAPRAAWIGVRYEFGGAPEAK